MKEQQVERRLTPNRKGQDLDQHTEQRHRKGKNNDTKNVLSGVPHVSCVDGLHVHQRVVHAGHVPS